MSERDERAARIPGPEFTVERSARMVGRGLARRCPLCGGGGLFRSWLAPRAACPGCGLRLDRGESDFFIGAYTVNFVTAEVVLAVFLGLVVLVQWPDVRWDLLVYGGVALMVLMPIAFFPFSRTLWLAIDLLLRSPTASDFDEEVPIEAFRKGR